MKVFISFLIFCFCLNLQAKTVVISDLDDTLRKSHVLSLSRAAGRLIKGVKPFEELVLLFKLLKQKQDQDRETIHFNYISASYRFLYDPLEWLIDYDLPNGYIRQRTLGEDKWQFKYQNIVELLEEQLDDPQNDLVLFFGDNAEYDPEIYAHVIKNLGLEKAHVFIRDVRANATRFSNQLSVTKINGSFFSELELHYNPLFSFLGTNTLQRVKQKAFNFELVPSYMTKELEERIEKELCPQRSSNRARIVCRINKEQIAKDLLIAHFKQISR